MSPNGGSTPRALQDGHLGGDHQDGSVVPVPETPPIRPGTSAIRARSEGTRRMALEMMAAIDRGAPEMEGGFRQVAVTSTPGGLGGPAGASSEAGVVNGLGGPAGASNEAGFQRHGIGTRLPPLALSAPQSFAPLGQDRLFSAEQQWQLEQMQNQAPQLYGNRTALGGGGQGRGHEQYDHERRTMTDQASRHHLQAETDRLHSQWQAEREKEEMLSYMKALHEENTSLKLQLSEERDQRYVTPESLREGIVGKDKNPADGKVQELLQRGRADGGSQEADSKMGDGFKRSLRMFGVPDRPKSPSLTGRPRSRSPTRPSGQKGTEPRCRRC